LAKDKKSDLPFSPYSLIQRFSPEAIARQSLGMGKSRGSNLSLSPQSPFGRRQFQSRSRKTVRIGQPTPEMISKEMKEHRWMSYNLARRVARDHLRQEKRGR